MAVASSGCGRPTPSYSARSRTPATSPIRWPDTGAPPVTWPAARACGLLTRCATSRRSGPANSARPSACTCTGANTPDLLLARRLHAAARVAVDCRHKCLEYNMSLPAAQQRILDGIADGLRRSEPRLAAMYATFTRMCGSEGPPSREQLARGWARRRAAAVGMWLRGKLTDQGRRARRRILIASQVAISLVLV